MKLLSSLVRRYHCLLSPATTSLSESLRSFSSKRGKHGDLNLKKSKSPKPSRIKAISTHDNINGAIAFPLTEEQSRVLTAVANGQSVFVTGSAGTGKTFLLSRVIDILKSIHGPSRVFVTASTGVAACALDGQTVHSFAGIGLARDDNVEVLRRVGACKRNRKIWNKARALVIDEISMISGDLFEKLEFIARNIQKEKQRKGRVWGGIQLIVSGDFFQLPPVLDPDSSESGKGFAFEAGCWNSSFDLQIELTQVFRQSDSRLIELLQGIRRGLLDPHKLQLLKLCCTETEPGTDVPRLFPRNQDVNRVNEQRLRVLEEEIIVYTALDRGDESWKRKLDQGIAKKELELCLGARVMLIKNIDPRLGLVNGTTGTIRAFTKPKDNSTVWDICQNDLLPVVEFDSGKMMVIQPEIWDVVEGEIRYAARKQIPLILAWALSIHKCQGMTLNSLHTDLSRAFGCGMVYVALSRVRSLNDLYLSGFKPSKIKADPRVLKFYESFPRCETPS